MFFFYRLPSLERCWDWWRGRGRVESWKLLVKCDHAGQASSTLSEKGSGYETPVNGPHLQPFVSQFFFLSPSPIYCYGDLLNAVQTAEVFNDSKEFVDRPLVADVSDVLDAFSKLPENVTSSDLREFVLNWTMDAGADIQPWIPSDWIQRSLFTCTSNKILSTAVGNTFHCSRMYNYLVNMQIILYLILCVLKGSTISLSPPPPIPCIVYVSTLFPQVAQTTIRLCHYVMITSYMYARCVCRPQFIDDIVSREFQDWALELNDIWRQLGRQVKKKEINNFLLFNFLLDGFNFCFSIII